MRTIEHWIGGNDHARARRPAAAASGTRRPASSRPRSCWPSRADVDAAVRAAREAFDDVVAGLAEPARPRCCSPSASWSNANIGRLAEAITDEHGKVLADATRRGAARPGGRRVRLRHPAAAQGRVLRPGLDRRRPVLVPPAARRLRRHHAVQLPGDGADVDVPGGDRLRQHVRAQAQRARPLGVDCPRRAVGRGRAARRASSTSSTATRRRSTRCSTTPTWPRCRSSARRRSRSTSTAGPPSTGKRVQALGGAKNHAIVLPDADLDFAADQLVAAGLRLGGRALHGDLGRRRASAASATTLVDAGHASRRRAVKVGPGRDAGQRDGPGRHRPRRATGSSG